MGMGGSSRQCWEGEGRGPAGPKEGCSSGIEVERATHKKEKDEAHMNAALGLKKGPGIRDAAIRFSY